MTSPPTSRTATRIASPTLLWVAAGVTVLLWASAFVVIRVGAAHFDPGALTLGRTAVGFAALTCLRFGMSAVRNLRHGRNGPRLAGHLPRGRHLALTLVWGVGWFAFYNLSLNAAEQRIDAGTASLLVNLAPMITAVLAGALLGEGFPRRLFAGILVSLTGVGVLAAASSHSGVDAIGIVLGLTAAVLYGSAAALQKRLIARVDAATMTWVGCAAAGIVCLPFAPQLLREIGTAPLASIMAIVYLGVFPTAIAFTTWGYVLARVSAGRTAATTYAVPAVAIGLSWALLAETPSPLGLLGGVLALSGIAITSWRSRSARRGVGRAPSSAVAGSGSSGEPSRS